MKETLRDHGSSAKPHHFFCLLRLLDRADGETGDESVEEQIVQERDGETGDETGSHERAPVVDIAANQKDRDARSNDLGRFGRDEGESVDKFLGHQGEGKDYDCENAGGGDGDHQFEEGAKASEAVDHGGVLQFTGNRFEKPHEKPDGKRNGKRRINENQCPERILQPKKSNDSGERNEEECRRDEISKEDGDAEALAAAPREAGQSIGSGNGQDKRYDDNNDTNESSIA